MILNFRSKALKRFFQKGDASKINPMHVSKIKMILTLLQVAKKPGDMDFYKSELHPLTGDRKGTWFVTVLKNWSITFKMNENGDAYDVDYEDYH